MDFTEKLTQDAHFRTSKAQNHSEVKSNYIEFSASCRCLRSIVALVIYMCGGVHIYDIFFFNLYFHFHLLKKSIENFLCLDLYFYCLFLCVTSCDMGTFFGAHMCQFVVCVCVCVWASIRDCRTCAGIGTCIYG